MKKRVLALIFAAVMVLSLTACGKEAAASESSSATEESSSAVVESSSAKEESSAVVESSSASESSSAASESSSAVAESSSKAPESSAAAESKAPAAAAATKYSKDGYSFTVPAGFEEKSVGGGVKFVSSDAANKNFFSLIIANPKAYGDFSIFTKDVLDPLMAQLFAGASTLSSHEFTKVGSFTAIKMTFDRTIDGVKYKELNVWVDTPTSCYQFEFLTTADEPATYFADVVKSINVTK